MSNLNVNLNQINTYLPAYIVIVIRVEKDSLSSHNPSFRVWFGGFVDPLNHGFHWNNLLAESADVQQEMKSSVKDKSSVGSKKDTETVSRSSPSSPVTAEQVQSLNRLKHEIYNYSTMFSSRLRLHPPRPTVCHFRSPSPRPSTGPSFPLSQASSSILYYTRDNLCVSQVNKW